MVHPFLDSGIILTNRFDVAELFINHITDYRECGRPRHFRCIIIVISRTNIRNTTVFTLRFTDIIRPFGIGVSIIEHETFPPRSHSMVAKPGLALVTLRTIQRHSFIITGNSPPGIPINPVHDIIGTLESTVIFQVIIYYFSNQIFRFQIFITCHFYILESMIRKTGTPGGVVFFTVADIIIRTLAMAEIFHIQFRTVILYPFGITYANRISRSGFRYVNTHPSCHILTEINHITVTILLEDSRFQRFHHFHVGSGIAAECTIRQ